MDIADLRQQVDRLDQQMLRLLDQRLGLARQIHAAKLQLGLPPRDAAREQEMLQAAREAGLPNLSAETAAAFRKMLLDLSRDAAPHLPPAPLDIAIIGLGLIGGSIARALKHAQPAHRLHGVDLPERLPLPQGSGLFEGLHDATRGADAVRRADVVFLCTPVGRTLQLLPELADDIPKKAVVTDVAGVKRTVTKMASEAFDFPDAPYFVGGHPMAGKATFGFENSESALFAGRPWILTPAADDPVDKLLVLRGLIESTGAVLQLMKPDEHDRAVTVASQLPQLVSTALMLTAGERANAMAGPALMEMTRLAASPAALWNELTRYTGAELIGELQSLKSYLTELEMSVHFSESMDKFFDRANSLRGALEAEVAKRAPMP